MGSKGKHFTPYTGTQEEILFIFSMNKYVMVLVLDSACVWVEADIVALMHLLLAESASMCTRIRFLSWLSTVAGGIVTPAINLNRQFILDREILMSVVHKSSVTITKRRLGGCHLMRGKQTPANVAPGPDHIRLSPVSPQATPPDRCLPCWSLYGLTVAQNLCFLNQSVSSSVQVLITPHALPVQSLQAKTVETGFLVFTCDEVYIFVLETENLTVKWECLPCGDMWRWRHEEACHEHWPPRSSCLSGNTLEPHCTFWFPWEIEADVFTWNTISKDGVLSSGWRIGRNTMFLLKCDVCTSALIT